MVLRRLLSGLLFARRDLPSRDSTPPAAPPAGSPVTLRYRPDVFDVTDEDSARRIILTPEGGESTRSRWERETPCVTRLALQELGIGPDSLVVDYGCGIGRIARELIASTGCRVIGVDISASMRRLAQSYVQSPRFEAIDPATLDARAAAGMRAEAAIACWVLQHCMDPGVDAGRLFEALRPGGRLLVVNNLRRAVPADRGWVDDGLDVAALLDARFRRIRRGTLDPEAAGPDVTQHSFVGIYERP
ncbi:hypothetical protein BURK1_02961 [Burkholderiales bacterium]|nr:hypothetical protein BURK1_02961 [Burkholderiales bacterium]